LGGRCARKVRRSPVDQQLQFGLGLGVAGQHDLAAVGRGQMDGDHRDGGELFERAARGQPRRERMELARQGDLQGVGEEGDEDVRLDPTLVLVEDRADREVALQILNASSMATSWT
jgi:hypothetical protein